MKRARSITRNAALVALCLLAAGCGTDNPGPSPGSDSGFPNVDGGPIVPDPGPGGSIPMAKSPGAFPRYGFALKVVPPGWRPGIVLDTPRMRANDEEIADLAAGGMASQGPLGRAFSGLQRLAQGGVTLAAQFLSGFGDVIQVEVYPAAGVTLQAYVQQRMATEPKRPGDEDLGQSQTKVGGKPAIRRRYSCDGGQRQTAAYHVLHQNRVYVIVCQSPSGRFDKMEPVYDKVVAGFQFLEASPF